MYHGLKSAFPHGRQARVQVEAWSALDGWELQRRFVEFAVRKDADFRRAFTMEILSYARSFSVTMIPNSVDYCCGHQQSSGSWKNVEFVFDLVLSRAALIRQRNGRPPGLLGTGRFAGRQSHFWPRRPGHWASDENRRGLARSRSNSWSVIWMNSWLSARGRHGQARTKPGTPPGSGQARNSALTSGLQEFAPFAGGAAAELGRVVPQVDAVTSAIRGMNAQLAIGATGVALVAAGVKAFINTRTSRARSAFQAMDIGIAPARLEEYQRKLARQSGGTTAVSRARK